jgi:tetratricopeptide (TPR) repeat protein
VKYYRVEILTVQVARQLIACVEINTILLQSWDGFPDSWGVRFSYSFSALELREGLKTKPNDPLAPWALSFALIGAEQFDEAIRTLEKAASLPDRSPAVLGALARAYAHGGRRVEALQLVDELRRRMQKGYRISQRVPRTW